MLAALFLSISSLFYSAIPDSICTVQSAPSFEPFEDPAWQIGSVIFSDPGDLGPCWSRSDTLGFYWTPFVGITSGGFSGPYAGVGGSGKYLYTSPGSGPTSTSLVTPRYYVAPLDTPAIEFYTHILAANPSSFVSMVVSADTGSGWFPIQTITTSTQIYKNSPWDQRVLYLKPYRSDTMQFKFTVTRAPNAYIKIGLDQFSIRDTSCPSILTPFSYSGTGFSRAFSVVNPKPNYSYQWFFGDGGTSTSLTPTHTYTAVGNYTVILTTTSECGRVDSSSGSIQVCAPTQPSIAYSLSGNTVSFQAQGAGLNNAYWSFGDGGFSTSLNPTHTYANTGAFIVQLSVSNACGENSTAYDTVFLCSPMTPEFTAQILSTNAQGMTVQFDASSSVGSLQSYLWNYGDNTTGSGLNPTKTYAIPGLNYLVTLTTVDSCGQSLNITKPLTQVSLADVSDVAPWIHPNPAQNRIFIHSRPEHRFLFGELYHSSGTCVAFIPQGTTEWDIRLLPAGMYYLVLTFPNERTTVPIVIAQP